ncbi:cupredoxin family protein [Niveispirillum sp.]|uniref:cupredoxin domain-containing protein n=1 Tax=Niveispirillum sp. TaxID=1917217 RepID=UPI001B4DB9E6|nr:cupredoxin family protein [Niveispirillum sp.]MBP7336999.1 cupredoxin family protein [Niveispirillum sp.]
MNATIRNVFAAALVAGFSLTLSQGAAWAQAAHDHHGHSHDTPAATGKPGKASAATRTVQIELGDNFFSQENLTVKAGETVRFVIVNKGEFLHEFNIGTAASHAEHQKMMAMMVDHGMLTPTGLNKDMANMDHSAMGMGHMDHDDANSVLVEPGKTGELVWTFGQDMSLEFACNVPGHYEAGMVGKISVTK